MLVYQASETGRFLLLQNRHFHHPWWSDVSESLHGCFTRPDKSTAYTPGFKYAE